MPDPRGRDPQRGGLARALTTPFAMVATMALALLVVNYVSGSPVKSWLESANSTGSTALDASSTAPGRPAPTDPAALSFGPIHFAGHANYVHRDNVTAAQIVVSDTISNSVRFITAFPNGNTGALASFIPLSSAHPSSTHSTGVGVSLKPRALASIHHAEDDQRGVVGELTFSGDVSLDLVLLGSVRTLRDYVESDVLRDMFKVELSGYAASDSPGKGEVWLSRQWINGTTVSYLGLFAADNNTILSPRPSDTGGLPSVNITRIDLSRNTTVRFETTFNFTTSTPPTPHVPLTGLGMDQLFVDADSSLEGGEYEDVVRAIRGPAKDVVDQLAFLAYESEFLAGGWRFLTYFGRDTLLAMQVLLPVLSPTAAEAILAGVIQRTSPTGELCHEETIGDYASAIHIHEGRPELGNTPEYDYKMVDTDFLLLPVLSRYAEAHPNRVEAFMQRNSTLVPGSFGELVQRNVDHVLELAKPFAAEPVKQNLIGLRAWPLGNWRDSPAGNGWGNYSFDVNCAMIPAALRAISSLATLGILPARYAQAAAQADAWEEHGCAHFAVPISSGDAEVRLSSYVDAANLSTSLLYGAGSLNETQTVSAHQTYGWTDPSQVVGDSTLYALSLTADSFQPIAVQHSDLCFALLNSPSVPKAVIQATLEAMQPYPRGLLTNAGMLVANAAYDTNASSVDTFANTAYHGAVAWSWQQAFMAAGIEAQLRFCDTKAPAWCETLRQPLRQAQIRLWDSIAGSQSVLWTEVWTPVFRPDGERGTFEIGDLGEISSDGSEGDAIQLWSYAFLALRDARTGRPVAEGFK